MRFHNLILAVSCLGCITCSAETLAADSINVGDLIEKVIAGKDFAEQEIVLTGVALNSTSSGEQLVNIGTQQTYSSSSYTNFVSVYDTTETIQQAQHVTLRVSIDKSSASTIGGESYVIIEATFIDCLSCQKQ